MWIASRRHWYELNIRIFRQIININIKPGLRDWALDSCHVLHLCLAAHIGAHYSCPCLLRCRYPLSLFKWNYPYSYCQNREAKLAILSSQIIETVATAEDIFWGAKLKGLSPSYTNATHFIIVTDVQGLSSPIDSSSTPMEFPILIHR